MAKRKTKVLVGLPNGGSVRVETLNSLMGFDKSGLEVGLCTPSSCLITKNRNTICEVAIKDNFDYVMFCDADMSFSHSCVKDLVESGKDIVAANCAFRKYPIKFTADNGQTPTTEFSKGLEKVKNVGTGFMLIKVDVLRSIPRPWFMVGYNPQTRKEFGEDYYFCKKAVDLGYEIYIDHDVSKMVKHIGTHEYGVV